MVASGVIFPAGALRRPGLFIAWEVGGSPPAAPAEGDFLTSGILIEVGGKSKDAKQVKAADSYLVAADDIEIGFGTKVPLWLFK
jgi:uncharacterized protein